MVRAVSFKATGVRNAIVESANFRLEETETRKEIAARHAEVGDGSTGETPSERLQRLVEPPQQPPQVDLRAFEREVGVPLPHDFARLASIYGIGRFDELVSVLAPDPGMRCGMFGRTQDERETHEYLAEDDPDPSLPYPIYPDDGGLLKWGEHDCGHRLWWLTRGHPDRWPVLIQADDGEDFFMYAGTATGLVCDLIEQRLDVWFMLLAVPWRTHRFDPSGR